MPKKTITTIFGGERPNYETLREAMDGNDDDEKAYRTGYQQGANEAFRAVQAPANLTTPRFASMPHCLIASLPRGSPVTVNPTLHIVAWP